MQSNKTCAMELYLEDQGSSTGFTISYSSKTRVQVLAFIFPSPETLPNLPDLSFPNG